MITLDGVQLPDGLVWADETAWTPVVQSVAYTLSGAVVVEETTKQTGRPITLEGGRSGRTSWAWMPRSNMLSLRSLLNAPEQTLTLALHDGRSFTVVARHDADGPMKARALPAIGEKAPANPSSDHNYVIHTLRFLEVT